MLPYSDTSNFPQGLGTITIGLQTFEVENAPGMSSEAIERAIVRLDGNGDLKDFQLRNGQEVPSQEITLQRPDTTVNVPPAGTTFTWDFDDSGTASTLVTGVFRNGKSREGHDIFVGNVYLVSYQS